MDSNNILQINFDNLFEEKYKNKYGIYVNPIWKTIEDVITFVKNELNLKELDLINEDGVYLGGFNSLDMLKCCKELKAVYQKCENGEHPTDHCNQQIEGSSSKENEHEQEPLKPLNRKRKHKKWSNNKNEIEKLKEDLANKCKNSALDTVKHIIFDDEGNCSRLQIVFKDMTETLTPKPRIFCGYALPDENLSSEKETDQPETGIIEEEKTILIEN